MNFTSFLRVPVSRDFIDILVAKVESVVTLPPSPPTTPGLTSPLPSLASFAKTLIIRSRVQPSTLFGAMVYLHRLRGRFNNIVARHECAGHRLLLAALIIAGKFLNDASPKNRHWSSYSQLFAVHDVSLMERQLLQHLSFDLIISNRDLMEQYQDFKHLSHSPPPTPQSATFPVVPSNVSNACLRRYSLGSLPSLQPRPAGLLYHRRQTRKPSMPSHLNPSIITHHKTNPTLIHHKSTMPCSLPSIRQILPADYFPM